MTRWLILLALLPSLAWAGDSAAPQFMAPAGVGDAIFPTPSQIVQAAEAIRVLPPPEAPGLVASTDQAEVCGRNPQGQTYSQAHRQTTPEMKAAAHRGTPYCGEIDHRLPLALGGADDVKNLWCQAAPPEPWNFHLKDALEVHVWRAVCREHTMTLAEGQAVFLAPDWRTAYCRLIGGPPCD